MKKIGRYDIVEELGRGAMGVVYKAEDPTIGRHVAIKVLMLDGPTEEGIPGAREIFMREARAAGRLSHPGIVTIHDALEDAELRRSYIVMEFIQGRTLESVLLDKGGLESDRALDIIRQIAEALDYAHRQQIIHRDLKPANILLTDDGRAKITDFGIAKIVARESAQRTVAIMGTPAYMSPEQVKGGEIDARSDLFSMGVLLYLMLTGEKPFVGDTAAVMFKVVYEDPILPSRLNPKLGSGHNYVALRCLAKDREKRYANAREVLEDLEDLRQGRAPRSEAKHPLPELRVGEPTVAIRSPLLAAPETSRAGPARGKWIAAGVFAGGVAVLALGLGLWRVRQREALPADVDQATAVSPAATSPSLEASRGPRPAAPTPIAPSAKRVTTPAAPKAPSTAAGSAPLPATAAAPKPTAAKPAAGRAVSLVCKHQLEEATLLVLSGESTIFQTRLLGKKKRGFIGIRGGRAGVVADSFQLPAGARELTVRVYSADGKINLLNKISATPPNAAMSTLEVLPTRQHLALSWTEVESSRR